jgi:hypothetical protein
VIGNGERVAVLPVAEPELSLEVGAPEVVWRCSGRERRSDGAMARPARNPDQPVPVQHGVDRALGGDANVAGQLPDQELADLARAPVRLLGLEPDDQAFDLLRELVGIAHRPAGPIAQCRQPVLLVAIKNLVAGLAGYPEFPAYVRHGLPVQETGDKAKAFFHNRTRSPRHPHLPLAKKRKV